MSLFTPPHAEPGTSSHTDLSETTCLTEPHAAVLDYYGQCQRAGELYCDFFDFVQFEEGGLLFFIGDVAGYGHSSKMIAAGIRNLLHSKPERGLKPLVEEINRAVCDLSPNGLYVTLFCGFADPVRRQLTYVSAGHEPVILFSRGSGRLRRLESTGTVLGLTTRSAYRQHSVEMEAGDILAAFTDGITEVAGANGEEFGEEGVVRVLRKNQDVGAAELSGAILASADQFGDDCNAADDRTVAIVRLKDRVAREPIQREAEQLAMAAA